MPMTTDPCFPRQRTIPLLASAAAIFYAIANLSAPVNQGPQSLVRFQTTRAVASDPASGNVHVSRVRYDIMRPCGPYIGINMLQALGINRTNNQPSLKWFGSATLVGSPTVNGTYTDVLSVTNIATNSYSPTTLLPSQFFRLKFP